MSLDILENTEKDIAESDLFSLHPKPSQYRDDPKTFKQKVLDNLQELEKTVKQNHHIMKDEINSNRTTFIKLLKEIEKKYLLMKQCNRNFTENSFEMNTEAPSFQPSMVNESICQNKEQIGMDHQIESKLNETAIATSDNRSQVQVNSNSMNGLNYNNLIEEISSSQNIFSVQKNSSFNNPNLAQLTSTLNNAVNTSSRNTPHQENISNSPMYEVLVEFKRKRILRFESHENYAAGEYVVVSADRGEDIGIVTYVWASDAPAPSVKWSGKQCSGVVLRTATILEITQFQGVQSELESKAVIVARQKVIEHMLPMQIVDAEYQFDRKKLTLYYQSEHRLDFRNLLRDLYKVFRARIWLEQE